MQRICVCCVVLFATATARADEAEDRAAAYVKQLGGQMLRRDTAPDSPVVHVNLGKKAVTDEGLRELAGFRHLEYLNLFGTEVTDAGLKELAAVKSLARLGLTRTKITDAGLKHLAALPNLVDLDLDQTAVTGTGFQGVEGFGKLTTLGLWKSPATDEGLKAIAGALGGLTELDLRDSKVTDAGVKELAVLKKMHYLSLPAVGDRTLAELRAAGLSHTIRQAVTAEGRHPRKLEEVATLYLGGTALTDAGVAELLHYKHATTMYLAGTKITDAGLAELRRGLPKCEFVK